MFLQDEDPEKREEKGPEKLSVWSRRSQTRPDPDGGLHVPSEPTLICDESELWRKNSSSSRREAITPRNQESLFLKQIQETKHLEKETDVFIFALSRNWDKCSFIDGQRRTFMHAGPEGSRRSGII